jgi:copper chaperone CopZ
LIWIKFPASLLVYLLLMSNPVFSFDAKAFATPLVLLDQKQEWSDFSQQSQQNPQVWTSSVVFEGMYCTACAINIEDALLAVPGVVSAQISAASHRGRVVWSSDTTKPSQWMKAVAHIGYRTVPANDAMAKQSNTAIIVVTHDEKIIPTFKRIYHIRDGVTHEEVGEGRTLD